MLLLLLGKRVDEEGNLFDEVETGEESLMKGRGGGLMVI